MHERKVCFLHTFVTTCVLTCVLVPVSCIFPYGSSSGDTANPQSTSGSSSPYSLSPALIFYNTSFSQLYVNNDGFISFTSNGTVFTLGGKFPNSFSAVCIFGADIVPRSDGRVWHRVSSASSDLQALQNITQNYDFVGRSFTPTWVLVATWVQVHSLPDTSTQGNTMQLVMASDGVTSVVTMEYVIISWVKDMTSSSSIRARVGFNKGDGVSSYILPESYSEALLNLTRLTNVNNPGFFLFRVDENAVVPAVLTTTETTTSTTSVPTTSSANCCSSQETETATTSAQTQASTTTTTSTVETEMATTSAQTQASTTTTTSTVETETATTSAQAQASTTTTTSTVETETATTSAQTQASTTTTPSTVETESTAVTAITPRETNTTSITQSVTVTSTTTEATSSALTTTSPATSTSSSTSTISAFHNTTFTSATASATGSTSHGSSLASTDTSSGPYTSANVTALTPALTTNQTGLSDQKPAVSVENYYIGFGVGGAAVTLLAVGCLLLARYYAKRASRVSSTPPTPADRQQPKSRDLLRETPDRHRYHIPRPKFSPRLGR